jgi:hypothetical protein
MTDLESLEALREKAAKGPWAPFNAGASYGIEGQHEPCHKEGCNARHLTSIAWDIDGHDAALIVALVNAFPAMAAELKALRAVAEAARGLVGTLTLDPVAGLPGGLPPLRHALAALSETP